METYNNQTTFAKGNTYSYEVEDYNDALALGNDALAKIEEQFKAENPYMRTCIFPFLEREGRYCVEVWMEYSDMTSKDDIHVRFFFKRNWFAAARKAVAERQKRREEENSVFRLFGLQS